MPAVRREIIFDPRSLQTPCSSQSRNDDRRRRFYKMFPTNTIQFVRAQKKKENSQEISKFSFSMESGGLLHAGKFVVGWETESFRKTGNPIVGEISERRADKYFRQTQKDLESGHRQLNLKI
jgi:phosphoribosyl 1,2-cyclic phosphodiesterase